MRKHKKSLLFAILGVAAAAMPIAIVAKTVRDASKEIDANEEGKEGEEVDEDAEIDSTVFDILTKNAASRVRLMMVASLAAPILTYFFAYKAGSTYQLERMASARDEYYKME